MMTPYKIISFNNLATSILILCFIADSILLCIIKNNNMPLDNSYYKVNIKYGLITSSIVILILILIIIHEIYLPSIKFGAVLMAITAYCLYVIKFFGDFLRVHNE